MNQKTYPDIDFSGIDINEATAELFTRSRFHSYLFYGDDQEGLSKLGERLAFAFLCKEGKNPDSVIPCGKCNSCKKFMSGNHTDFIRVDSSVKADELRYILEKMNYSPIEGVARIFLINGAEELSLTCQNLLLKSIEEPNDDNYFILTTVSPDRLLPTVRSRCMMLSTDSSDFNSEEDESIKEFIQAAVENDQTVLNGKIAEIESIKENKRDAFVDFLHKISVAFSYELIKTIKEDEHKSVLISEIKSETDKILIKAEQINFNINLWATYLVFQINTIHDRYKGENK